MKEAILELLRQRGGYLSGQAISRQMGLTRARVWKLVQDLRREGYEIDSAPRRGYFLREERNRLLAQEIRRHLKQDCWLRELHVLETVGSTNDYAKALAAGGAPEGTMVIADSQSAGRGRMGRSFLSPPGQGLYLSAILRPCVPPMELMHLTCCVAEAACDAVEATTGLRPGIKWTNDLICGGRKLAGVLTELSLERDGTGVRYAVVGVGINCGQEYGDFDPSIRTIAGSLRMATGRETDRNLLAAELIGSLGRLSVGFVSGRRQWMERYRRDCHTIGQAVAVHGRGDVRFGQALDVDDWGALLVDFGEGPEPVQSGEVSIRGLSGG